MGDDDFLSSASSNTKPFDPPSPRCCRLRTSLAVSGPAEMSLCPCLRGSMGLFTLSANTVDTFSSHFPTLLYPWSNPDTLSKAIEGWQAGRHVRARTSVRKQRQPFASLCCSVSPLLFCLIRMSTPHPRECQSQQRGGNSADSSIPLLASGGCAWAKKETLSQEKERVKAKGSTRHQQQGLRSPACRIQPVTDIVADTVATVSS